MYTRYEVVFEFYFLWTWYHNVKPIAGILIGIIDFYWRDNYTKMPTWNKPNNQTQSLNRTSTFQMGHWTKCCPFWAQRLAASPGLLLRCPPPAGRCGPPARCRDSAAPEPPARCTSCSRSLNERRNVRRESWRHGEGVTSCWLLRFSLTFVRVVVADVFDGVPHHLLVVHVRPRGDLSTEQHHACLTHRFWK